MSRYISLSIGSETGETDNLRVATYRLGPPLSAASKKAERSKRKAARRKEKEERARVTQLGPGDGGGLFDVEYVKKGGVREWDMGK